MTPASVCIDSPTVKVVPVLISIAPAPSIDPMVSVVSLS